MEAGEPGYSFNLRDYVVTQKECDVFIEGGKTTASNLLVSWLDGHHAIHTQGPALTKEANDNKPNAEAALTLAKVPRRFVFDTHDPKVFCAVKDVVEGLQEGWVISGPHYYGSHYTSDSSTDAKKAGHTNAEGMPVVVYGRNAAATIHKAERLLHGNLVAAEDICLLLDTMQGINQVRRLSQHVGYNIAYICIAETYDELFEAARQMVRQGYTPDQIQARMDTMVSRGSDFMVQHVHGKFTLEEEKKLQEMFDRGDEFR